MTCVPIVRRLFNLMVSQEGRPDVNTYQKSLIILPYSPCLFAATTAPTNVGYFFAIVLMAVVAACKGLIPVPIKVTAW